MDSIASFVSYYESVHRRTARLVPLLPPAQIEWRPHPTAFSFGDMLRHLGGINRWMWAETVAGRPSRYPGHGTELASGFEATRDYFARCQTEAMSIFGTLSEEDYRRPVTTPAGVALAASKWLRAMVEHEAHHRGQLYMMLRMIGVETPPVFGLTSEQVRRNSAVSALRSPRAALRGRDAHD
jgi:uncharacterized damage-inducible protein DinB